MAKNSFSDWSVIPEENTDLAGISTLGSAPVSNFDDIVRQLMAQIRAALRTSVTLVTQSIAEAGTDAEIAGWSALRVRQAAVAADPLVPVASYTGAQLSGLTSVTLDLPAGFSTFRVLIDGVATASAAVLIMRCGVAGGALDQGASDYNVVATGRQGGTDAGVSGPVSSVDLAALRSEGNSLVEVTISDGSANGFWRAFVNEVSQASDGNVRNIRRAALRAVTGARKRLSIISTVALANSGSIKIYGVR